MLNASNIESSKRVRQPHLEPGSYPARVVQVLDLGLQAQRPYKGEEKTPNQEIMVTYELLDEFVLDEDGKEIEDKPRWISERLPLHSLDTDLAKSTKRYFALDPDKHHNGDWVKVLNTPCMVVLTTNPSSKDKDIVYNNVSGVSTMRSKEASKAPDLQTNAVSFDTDMPNMEVFWNLPNFVLKLLTEDNLNFAGSVLEQAIKDNPKPETSDDKSDDSGSSDKSDNEVSW